MPTRPTSPTPLARGDPAPIAPHRLWSLLTADQQRPLLQALLRLGHQLLEAATRPQPTEAPDD
jgi:hypothetical protein